MFYILAFAGAVVFLAAWFLHRTNSTKSKFFQTAFFASLVTYLLIVGLSGVSPEQKLQAIFRDLSVMAGFGLAARVLFDRSQTIGLGAGVAALVLVAYQWVIMPGTLSANHSEAANYDAEGELLLELSETAQPEALDAIVHKYGLEIARAFRPVSEDITELDDYWLVDVPTDYLRQLPTITKELQNIPEVDWVELNETIQLDILPADSGKKGGTRYGLNDPGAAELWGFEAMQMERLYLYLESQRIRPVRKALIAILDTGVDAQHEDIKGNFRSLDIPSDNDPRGHGTHCAGIAAAVSNNGMGIASFSRSNDYVEVTSFKVLGSAGIGTQRTIINGMVKAADAGADVISLSLGGISNQSKERAYQKAVAYANAKGCIVVVAAGNSNRNAKNYVPAGVSGVITVSAVDQSLTRAAFSNTVGELPMGIAAPGVNIYSTLPDNKYGHFNGTSMATPYVSGLVGLMRSIDPNLDTKAAYQILEATGRATQSNETTGPLIQPYEAVRLLIGDNISS